ncbi:MAG: type II toxin-antitoxin system RelE/ParE family toxin [Archaeoglobus sp.]|nr:type II toxin-antitoxin system RelE/ParE family toxin [Archaeoglobus sp.]
MSYENRILISKRALKELKNIPARDRKTLKDRISKLAFFPLAHLDVKKLKGMQNIYRLRIGDYRIIFEYNKDERLVKILKLGKRGGIYD